MAQNWVMMISELHRYQGVSYKSDIIVISGNTSNIMQSVVLLKPRIQLHVSTYLNMYNHNYKYIREGLKKIVDISTQGGSNPFHTFLLVAKMHFKLF